MDKTSVGLLSRERRNAVKKSWRAQKRKALGASAEKKERRKKKHQFGDVNCEQTISRKVPAQGKG